VAAFNWNPARHQLESVAALRWNTHVRIPTIPARDSNLKAATIPINLGHRRKTAA
jgi:hypothetical protein